ncbi:MAG: citrate synthase [Burkholderiales bacterium]|nr:citrate synthase [Burkholderiales bacterium]
MDSGLEGVVAAETVLSHTDGERGIVVVRGHSVQELILRHGFEGSVALLWDGFAGEGLTRASIAASFGQARQQAFERLGSWLDVGARQPLIEAVRIGLAAVPDASTPAQIAATMPVAVAALLRAQRGEAPLAPDPSLGTAADFLRMLYGAPPEANAGAALDTYFTAIMDNGLNASAFTARVVASTRASLPCATLGGYCAFTGALHGGAPGPTLDMLDEAAASGDIDAWLERTLAAGGRLMGFGHRVFRVRDPRADALRESLRRLGPSAGRLAFAADFERRALAALERHKPGRSLQTNVEINAALLLDALGLPRAAFMPVFAIGRCAGWIAHALEQQKSGRMIRPLSRYVGAQQAQ